MDSHRGIQARTSHQLAWEPGHTGKGYIGGVYGPDDKWLGPSVNTWKTDGYDGTPVHSAMGGHEMCFTMDPSGRAEYHAWTETPEMVQKAHQIIGEAEPRLDFTPQDPEEFNLSSIPRHRWWMA